MVASTSLDYCVGRRLECYLSRKRTSRFWGNTVFPENLAVRLGIDLTNAPIGQMQTATLGRVPVRYALVHLRITDGLEQREWPAWVGFTPAPLNHSLLGFGGFLQFFTATFHGDREQVELTVNSLYPGT